MRSRRRSTDLVVLRSELARLPGPRAGQGHGPGPLVMFGAPPAAAPQARAAIDQAPEVMISVSLDDLDDMLS